MPKKESVMPAQFILGLIIFFVSYIGTAFLLTEALVWVMMRLDDRRASARSAMPAIENVIAVNATTPCQANQPRIYPSKIYISDSQFLLSDQAKELVPVHPVQFAHTEGRYLDNYRTA